MVLYCINICIDCLSEMHELGKTFSGTETICLSESTAGILVGVPACEKAIASRKPSLLVL